MHIAAEEKEFLDESNIKNLVRKYCSFMPYNIYVSFKGDGKDEPLNSTPIFFASFFSFAHSDELIEFGYSVNAVCEKRER